MTQQSYPTLHKPIPIGTKVIIPPTYHNLGRPVAGVVEGIASEYIMFHYIVVLDERIDSPHGKVKAVTVDGTKLEDVSGNN